MIFAVFMASWLDNFLLTVVVPIVPQYIAKLDAIAREKDMMGVTDGMMMGVTDRMMVTGGMDVRDGEVVTEMVMNVTERMVTTMERGQWVSLTTYCPWATCLFLTSPLLPICSSDLK